MIVCRQACNWSPLLIDRPVYLLFVIEAYASVLRPCSPHSTVSSPGASGRSPCPYMPKTLFQISKPVREISITTSGFIYPLLNWVRKHKRQFEWNTGNTVGTGIKWNSHSTGISYQQTVVRCLETKKLVSHFPISSLQVSHSTGHVCYWLFYWSYWMGIMTQTGHKCTTVCLYTAVEPKCYLRWGSSVV
jgi:hypothetical protein